ncbi:TRAP-type mannitol/chloroaromatic compound transport system, small permease component [Beggiatoa alba B18LD]|uniref:TRAP transporter small permease protein n=1 Tax=Beggiatoa alba B18LD TaxID=395493 RepID=I3CDT1_9GAMM|nr:TRAP transporter small permease subunit [Beggiatoa alba]EIJ41774.1 TRAP-type mannitol/chloroaromatic compound transport system, small permease component [Beggiatoa alba B18LD]
MKPIQKIVRGIDSFSEWTGIVTAWLILLMVLTIVYDVFMRAMFNQGSVMLQELQWHLFAIAFLLGSAYTLKYDDHVRVDIIYRSRWVSPKARAWIDLLGSVFFLIPFSILIVYSSYDFVYNAYAFQEGSPDAGGLPYRFVLKAALPLCFIFLILQGIADALRQIMRIVGQPIEEHP